VHITDGHLCSVCIVQSVQNNGTLYIHVYFVKAGNSPNPADETHEKRFTVCKSRRKSFSGIKTRFVESYNCLMRDG